MNLWAYDEAEKNVHMTFMFYFFLPKNVVTVELKKKKHIEN